MIEKENRVYVRSWFDDGTLFREGDLIMYEMPPFVSGDYRAEIFLDTDGDPYIHKDDDHLNGCRSMYIHYRPYTVTVKDVIDFLSKYPPNTQLVLDKDGWQGNDKEQAISYVFDDSPLGWDIDDKHKHIIINN